jgi:hypothetical protein
MTAIHRREMLGIMLGGTAVAVAGLALIASPAESTPLMMSHPAYPESPVEEAVVVVRRRRRRVCWWRRGRRVCAWR